MFELMQCFTNKQLIIVIQIYSPMDKTEKKVPYRLKSDSKRFARQRSVILDPTIENTRHVSYSPITPTYIKTPKKRTRIPTFDEQDFFKKLAHKLELNEQDRSQSPHKSHLSKQNYVAKVSLLEQELQVKNQKIEAYTKEIQRLKYIAEQQKKKRYILEQQKKQKSKQLQSLQASYKKIEIQNKRLIKEKQYTLKQINFLENINFDDRTKELQSFRERYLEQELAKLREYAKKNKTQRQKNLEQEVSKLYQQKYTLQAHLKSAQIANQCLMKQLNQAIQDQRQFVMSSEQYVKLRQKYKKFLQEYKVLRSQYSQLKRDGGRNKKNQSSLISMTFSQAD